MNLDIGWTIIVFDHPVSCRVQVKELPNPDTIFETILGHVVRLAEHGLIHCDFNEFNIMVSYCMLISWSHYCVLLNIIPLYVVFCNLSMP